MKCLNFFHVTSISIKNKLSHKINRNQYLGYYFTDLILFYIVPLLLSVILYGLIAKILYQSRHNTKSTHHGTNGQLSVDSSKTNASRVQVTNDIYLLVHYSSVTLFYRVSTFWHFHFPTEDSKINVQLNRNMIIFFIIICFE